MATVGPEAAPVRGRTAAVGGATDPGDRRLVGTLAVCFLGQNQPRARKAGNRRRNLF